jgi:dihydropteroate synthase
MKELFLQIDRGIPVVSTGRCKTPPGLEIINPIEEIASAIPVPVR